MQTVTCPHCSTINSPERANCYLCERPLRGGPYTPEPAFSPDTPCLSEADVTHHLDRQRRVAVSVLVIAAVANGLGATFLLFGGGINSSALSWTNPRFSASLLGYTISAILGL